MANAKVTVESGVPYKGKRYLKGETIEGVSELQVERWERIGYAKATVGAAKSASKASPKAAAKKAANLTKTTGKANAAAKKVENKTTGEAAQ